VEIEEDKAEYLKTEDDKGKIEAKEDIEIIEEIMIETKYLSTDKKLIFLFLEFLNKLKLLI